MEREVESVDRRLRINANDITSSLLKAANDLGGDRHDKIAIRVFRRLRLRHVQLAKGVEEAHKHLVRDGIKATTESSAVLADASTPSGGRNTAPISAETRAYRLAVTDLFVEKALDYLEDQALHYRRLGYGANIVAVLAVITGAVIAAYQAGFLRTGGLLSYLEGHFFNPNWQYLVMSFTRAFTAYGMIVLIAVGLWRIGKAMLDQAERLMERRHALRQGRLFVHLNDGQLSIQNLEKAFNWNVSQSNAFANIPTHAQAPWGAVAKEIIGTIPDLVRAVNSKVNKRGTFRRESASE